MIERVGLRLAYILRRRFSFASFRYIGHRQLVIVRRVAFSVPVGIVGKTVDVDVQLERLAVCLNGRGAACRERAARVPYAERYAVIAALVLGDKDEFAFFEDDDTSRGKIICRITEKILICCKRKRIQFRNYVWTVRSYCPYGLSPS